MKTKASVLKKMIVLLYVSMFFLPPVNAQPPALLWEKCFGGSDYDAPTATIATSDGGVIVAGKTLSDNDNVNNNHGGYDVLVIKINTSGTLQWQKTIGGNLDDLVCGITETSDGDYLLVGKTNSTTGDLAAENGIYDGWIARLDREGKLKWAKTMGTSGNDCFNAVFEYDGNISIAGSISMGSTDEQGYSDFLLLRTDVSGKVQWARSYGGSSSEFLTSAARTVSGDFLLCGYTSSDDGMLAGHHGKNDVWIIKVDARGIMYWQKVIGKSVRGNNPYCVVTHDSGFLVSGFQQSKEIFQKSTGEAKSNFTILKFSNSGEEEWKYLFSEKDNAHYKQLCCFEAQDGGYYTSGIVNQRVSHGASTTQDVFIMKLDAARETIWKYNMEAAQKNFKTTLCQSNDGSIVISSNRFCSPQNKNLRKGFDDYCVLKISSSVNIAAGK